MDIKLSRYEAQVLLAQLKVLAGDGSKNLDWEEIMALEQVVAKLYEGGAS